MCTAAASITYNWANAGANARGMVVDAVGGSLFVATLGTNVLKRVTASPGMSGIHMNVLFWIFYCYFHCVKVIFFFLQ